MPLDLNADITKLRGADYNPRRIEAADLEVLAESIKAIGLVKPLIVRGDLIVAGHQRTRTLRALGIGRAAVYRLPVNTTVYDEIRFNQLHNGTDLDSGDENCRILGEALAPGWNVIEPGRLSGNLRATLAAVRSTICELILKYGPWGASVATRDGRIIHAAQYALAAIVTRTPLTVYVLSEGQEAAAARYLGRSYGVFSYDHLEKKTYIQTLAQMNRLRGGPSGKENKSALYENHVLKWIPKNPGARLIDFGSGHGDYAAALRGRGIDCHDVELFRRNRQMSLDKRAINSMISKMVSDLEKRGPYDAVICDSVLNSVDCLEAETAVLTIINALAKRGGAVFFSGRSAEQNTEIARYTKQINKQQKRRIEFLDDKGFTALYRQGRWFYQKFHSKADVSEICDRFGFKIIRHVHVDKSWQLEAEKQRDLPIEQVLRACQYEFDLPLGDDERIGRSNDVVRAFRLLYQTENAA